MEKIDLKNYGPLAQFIGRWEGAKGDDTAPGDDRGTEKNSYREVTVFVPMGVANNHEQALYGLSYSRTAWRLNEDTPFHEQIGYWHWDAQAKQVFHAFMIPRGMTVLAGGVVETGARVLKLSAELGSPTFGICSNPFLDREFKTVKYNSTLTLIDDSTYSYEEDTQILLKGRKEVFHHIDKNTLKKVKPD